MRLVADLTLHRRLLTAIAAAPPGSVPASSELAPSLDSSLRSVNSALAHLAEEGLVEGLWNGTEWSGLRLTPRGRSRAGRGDALPAAVAAVRRRTPTTAALRDRVGTVAGRAAPAWGAAARRTAAYGADLRLRAAAAYRMFTNFP